MHRNFVRDAMYGILHHCEQQRSNSMFSSNQRHSMAQTGQIPDALAEGLVSLGMKLIEAAMESEPSPDVLASATTAYQQGKITKNQLMAVINALDESTYQTRAYTEPSYNAEYLNAQKYLDQYRR